VNDILPRLRRLIGDVELWIVGRSPAPEVLRLDGGSIRVTGTVPDVVPYYERSAVAVVPLRAGSGTRLKILEAMALGRPVVSTSVGCEGLDVEHERHLLVADDAEAFARQTARLLADGALYRRLADEGRRLVEARYDWSVLGDRLLDVYAQATGQPRRVPEARHVPDRQGVTL
jgi:glycosyltransferase involved in cell wall biosynthesis